MNCDDQHHPLGFVPPKPCENRADWARTEHGIIVESICDHHYKMRKWTGKGVTGFVEIVKAIFGVTA